MFLFLQILLHQSHAQKGLSTRPQQHIGIQGLASERHGTRRWVSRGYELANPFELLPFQSSAPSKKYYHGITWKKQQWNSPIFLHNTIEYISNLWPFESHTPRKALVGLSIFPLIMAILPWQSTFLMTAPSIFIDMFMVRWKSNRLIDVYRCWIASFVPHLFYLWWILPFHPGLPVRHGALRRPWRGPCPPTPTASFCFISYSTPDFCQTFKRSQSRSPRRYRVAHIFWVRLNMGKFTSYILRFSWWTLLIYYGF